ncbi:hypothetical protein E4S40_05435 [Algoriphagus kandeliae]|uniref:HEPN domain-containing protein n=1 Tax=Algoriphagus kandeliae TaxID=2562278 RepID=A0A4Y9QT17_9BACT|nr:hypothetical protein [Algoriphagus kandeliae]TFV95664.1 hypothetical protein E4S40_05435 [Algoriphagus kandeliae]
MENLKNPILDKADNFFYAAKDELCRPEEDVVAYSVCRNAYYAVVNYLGSFLGEHGVEFQEKDQVDDLLKQCRAIDGKFNTLNLSPMYRRADTEDPWMNIDMANDFIIMAENTRKVVSGN